MDYLQNGLAIPEKIKEWTSGQRMQWDDIGQFIAECCEIEEYQECPDDYKYITPASDLHEYFQIWYGRNKDSRDKAKISAKFFSALLDKKSIASKRSNGTKRLGIHLTTECDLDLTASRDQKAAKSNSF